MTRVLPAGVVVSAALAELIEQAFAPPLIAALRRRLLVWLYEHLDQRCFGLIKDNSDQPKTELTA